MLVVQCFAAIFMRSRSELVEGNGHHADAIDSGHTVLTGTVVDAVQ